MKEKRVCEMEKDKVSMSGAQQCFMPEEGNPYPLCVGRGMPECAECQLRAGWEPECLYDGMALGGDGW